VHALFGILALFMLFQRDIWIRLRPRAAAAAP
jgi:hypothetical protein